MLTDVYKIDNWSVCVSEESTDGAEKASSSKTTDWESIKWDELGQTKDAR